LVKDTPFQAIVCHQPFNCLSLLIRRKLQDVSLLYVFHSPSHEEYLLAQENRSWVRNLAQAQALRMIERFCVKKAMKIMVLSHYMKEKLRDIHGISANRIVVNPGGVDLNRFRPPINREAIRDKLGFAKGKIHLLSVRNLEPRMGLDNLLQGVRILRNNAARIHLILGGEGIERQHLERLVKVYGLADAVTMTGFIPSDLLPQYYGASDFFVLPTRHLEGFGLVTPESLACGTPVLGTPVGGTREILSGFSPDFLFRDTSPEAIVQGIQKAIARFFPGMKRYEQLRDQCRAYAVRSYSWQRHINQLKTMIEEVVASKNYLLRETLCQEP
jgi:glycosyltransferase involved in cell wall biosynthesis